MTARIAVLAFALVVTTAGPAAAAGAAPVLAAQRFWFYWIAPLLVLGFVGFIGAFAVGYVHKVLRPKYRGRPSEK